tara:strand:+ start:5614 stop:5796 length:183 start_codon:yes stop_codon:yes gene_type:complete
MNKVMKFLAKKPKVSLAEFTEAIKAANEAPEKLDKLEKQIKDLEESILKTIEENCSKLLK